jgi:predicted Zn-dependent protease
MAILSKEEAQKLLQKVLSFSKAEECEAGLSGSEGGNIRYARNAVSTAGEISRLSLAVSSTFGKKTGTATIDEFDDASLEKVVRRAEELAQLSPDNPEHVPLLGPQTYPDSITYVPATAAITPDTRAEAVGKSIAVSREAKLQDTDVLFTITTRNEDGTGSGYAARGYHDI